MRRLIEHQVAVRAFGALNSIFNTCPGASASGLYHLRVSTKMINFATSKF